MTWQWSALVGLAVVTAVLLVALVRLRRRTTTQLDAARQESEQLRERLDRLEQERAEAARPEPARPPVHDEREYTITRVGDPAEEPAEPVRLERSAFADLVLRESVIRVGSLAHGVRRALDAETRNRIRFEMRREVKRARKQRRAEQREAYRDWQSRQRARIDDDEMRESA